MSRALGLLAWLWIWLFLILTLTDSIPEDVDLNTFELIKKYGYPAENHTFKTDDGYLLTVHRIARQNATPVLLLHGLFDTSATWVLMGPDKGLGYLLYEQGYDVWLGNVRGNTYAKKHVKYTVDQKEFWDFSYHEIAVLDLPNTVDYVLDETGFSQLHYIGHSQGTSVFWIMGSERPEYMEKILFMQALAPFAFCKYAKSPLVIFLGATQRVLLSLFANELVPNTEFVNTFADKVCTKSAFGARFCMNALFTIVGFNKAQVNETMLPVIFGHTPAGASTKQLLHIGQVRAADKFRPFDYGALENVKRYRSLLPPNYKLENVRVKVALYYSQNDYVVHPGDVTALTSKLPNVVFKYLVKDPHFNHLDFTWAVDGRELLFDIMLEQMRSYETKD